MTTTNDVPPDGSQHPGARPPSVRYETRRLQRRHMWGLALVSLAFTAVWTAMPSIMLPNQVQQLEFARFFSGRDAGVDLQALTQLRDAVRAGTAIASTEQQRLLGLLARFEEARATSLGIVVSIAVVVTIFVQPLVGEFSDRTRSRGGRRAPWILYGGLVGAVAVALLPLAPAVAVVAFLWTVGNGAISAANTALVTTVVDREPKERVGAASSMTGFGNFVGGILGAVAAGALFTSVGLGFYFVLAVGVALATTLFVLRLRDRSSEALDVPAFRLGSFLRGFLVPLRARDFRWVWISRVLIFFGYGISSALGLYMMQSYIRPALSQAEATALVPYLGVVGVPLTLVAILVAGRVSDRVGRRKPFVIAAGALMAASMLVPLISPTLPALFVQAILGALAFGVFIPVDQALFVDVLPDRESVGRDLGIAGTATSLGNALAPIAAAQVVTVTGGYAGVWIVALVLVGLAAVTVLRAKGAR